MIKDKQYQNDQGNRNIAQRKKCMTHMCCLHYRNDVVEVSSPLKSRACRVTNALEVEIKVHMSAYSSGKARIAKPELFSQIHVIKLYADRSCFIFLRKLYLAIEPV